MMTRPALLERMGRLRSRSGIVAALLGMTLVSAAACESTGPREDDDPLTDTWELTAEFTQYFHEGGGQSRCGYYVEHCGVIDTVAGPRLKGVLTIYSGVRGHLTLQPCDSLASVGSCARYGKEQSVIVPSGTVDSLHARVAGDSVGLDLEVQLPSGLTWTGLHLRDAILAGDSLSGSIFWEDYPEFQAVRPAYIGTFVAHRRR